MIVDALANFVGLIAIMLVLRNIGWAGQVVQLGRAEGWPAAYDVMMQPRRFPQWVVRAGTLIIATLCGIGAGAVTWRGVLVRPGWAEVAVCVALMLCATLLAWRWQYFAEKRFYSMAGLIGLALVAIILPPGGIWRF